MNLKVVTWNVNGLRAALKNTNNELKGFLNSLEADIICLQETKATKDQLDSSTYQADGYSAYFSFCKVRSGYSGVVTFCRSVVTPVAAEEGLTGQLSMHRKDAIHCRGGWAEFTDEELSALDAEGRAVLTEHACEVEGEEGGRREGRVVVVNVYCPMVDSDNQERMTYKLRFYQALQSRCAALHQEGKLLVVVGDFNCSREAMDSAYAKENPSLLTGSSPTRQWMQQFAFSHPDLACAISPDSTSVQLIDVFRYLHPAEEKAYTCWSTLTGARKTNYGTRIDYILVSPVLAPHVRKSEAWQEVEGSDHCPVFAEISLSVAASEKPPSLCSCFFSEGKQTTLSAFFSRQQSSRATATGEKSVAHSAGAGGSARGQKRGSTTATDVPAKARKRSAPSTAKGHTLFSLFKKTAQAEGLRPEEMDERQESKEGNTLEVFSQEAVGRVLSQAESELSTSLEPVCSQSPQLSAEWRTVFTGPPKPPPCKGHSEPCVLRTVKKAGPNRNRQFWTCARPAGSKNNPQARCDFFKWVSKPGSKT